MQGLEAARRQAREKRWRISYVSVRRSGCFVTKPVGGFLASSGPALNVRRLATSLLQLR